MPTAQDVREMALALPETSEKPCYGTPGFYVRTKFFARVLEDGESVGVKVDLGEREALVAEAPDVFVITPHYERSSMVAVRFGPADPEELREVLEESWRRAAPKRLLAAFDAAD